MTPLVLSVFDVSQALAVDRKSVYALIDSGQLHAVRIGRAIRIPRQSLDQFLAADTSSTERKRDGVQTTE